LGETEAHRRRYALTNRSSITRCLRNHTRVRRSPIHLFRRYSCYSRERSGNGRWRGWRRSRCDGSQQSRILMMLLLKVSIRIFVRSRGCCHPSSRLYRVEHHVVCCDWLIRRERIHRRKRNDRPSRSRVGRRSRSDAIRGGWTITRWMLREGRGRVKRIRCLSER